MPEPASIIKGVTKIDCDVPHFGPPERYGGTDILANGPLIPGSCTITGERMVGGTPEEDEVLVTNVRQLDIDGAQVNAPLKGDYSDRPVPVQMKAFFIDGKCHLDQVTRALRCIETESEKAAEVRDFRWDEHLRRTQGA